MKTLKKSPMIDALRRNPGRTTFLNVLDPNMHVGKSREITLDRMHPNCIMPLTFAHQFHFSMIAK
jgi:hypothetical protein